MQPHKPAPPRPFIPDEARLPELTAVPLIVGSVLGAIFGASSLYLTLKVGLTVSASIPVAVISVTLFRLLQKAGGRGASILENNIVQTAGSAGESIAFGVGATMPAILILGADLDFTRVMLVSILGGLLGILMMIPLRRAMIVEQHYELKFPEGTACAEVLKAGATDEELALAATTAEGSEDVASVEAASTGARTIFGGFAFGLLYKTAMSAFRAWKEIPERVFGAPFTGGSVSAEISPELLGVGYIIGPQIASIMCAGGVLSYLVLIPAIKIFGTGIIPPGTMPIADMTPDDVRDAYVLYIGAGAVAAGGIISLLRSLPTIWHGLRAGLGDVRRATGSGRGRTEQDMSMKVVGIGIVVLMALILAFHRQLHMNLLGALLIVIFGFLFVVVSSRLTGEIGSSSNPISGMTVATLLLTCLIFLAIGWTGPTYYVTALSVGAIVCIAASNGGTTSQDLKTGFLVGATPKAQQVAILVGTLTSALVLGPILLKLNDAATVYVPLVNPAVRVDPSTLTRTEKLQGPQAVSDPKTYKVWFKADDVGSPAGRYLVDERGVPVYQVDPGINGTHHERPGGGTVQKFSAPKATLVSYIIKGILNRQLPWGLVLLGVMIAVVLEMSGIPSLAFAVGVYLPLSASTPILAGGLVRWLVDRHLRKKLAHRNLTEEELTAEGDKSPGVLLASGYIAGGAIAGIVIAFLSELATGFDDRITTFMASNPFFGGPWADALSMIPFAVLSLLLYLAGREKILV
ncbi:MAG TPA: oligopeptide transporter, OPT family [Thermoanaerobaculia bacterium]|jgi:putative OPT family oligopeptide transporter|nr:oligopeptide transporter, OPT family [Thermoanaerobaculia bacterium]